jgi:hypothetical protein
VKLVHGMNVAGALTVGLLLSLSTTAKTGPSDHPACPGGWGAPLCASQWLCGENSNQCANASESPTYYCCLTHESGCCQYLCGNWTCYSTCQIKWYGIIGPQIDCPSKGSTGTERFPVAGWVSGICQSNGQCLTDH